MTPRETLRTPGTVRRAVRTLAAGDPALAALMRRYGPVRLPPRVPGGAFAYLVRAVVYQQVATAAARAIHRRVRHGIGDPRGRVTPAAIRGAGLAGLRRLGLSGPKAETLLRLAAAVEERRFVPSSLARLDDAEITARITNLPGFGRWSAEIFLIFHLGRTDVFPATDLAIRQSIATLHGEDEAWASRRADKQAERWRPYRSAAAWYLWHAYSGRMPGGG